MHLIMVKPNQSRLLRLIVFYMYKVLLSFGVSQPLLSAERVYYSQVLLLLGLPVYGLNTWCRSSSPARGF